ncbi:A disintegrin and metalloproteinase with thrombospondin motifs 9 [Holothuria leucospilota]|uniref:A disintegrin and metalloproteinase with thrombospondin motifs 9 n=1 Tax=Holothuria leucospilota TaxID=206669 RepID=A0A9Q0YDW6_HOLLE|nr:A disintegrin and metalloproteinase with thrombospondin motifs 9 [Holothuria leucospilota]
MITTVKWTFLILVSLLVGPDRNCSEGRAAPFLKRDDLREYTNNPEEILDYDVFEAHVDHRGRYHRSASDKYASRVTFAAFDEDYHLDLVLAEEFFPPDLKVEYLNKNGSITKKPLDVKDCFYHGYAISHNASAVALSLCNGKMRGLISTKSDNIYITPLTKAHSDDYAQRHKRNSDGMHLIYKRNVNDGSFCGVKTFARIEDDIQPTVQARVNPANLDFSYIPPKFLEIFLMLDVDFVNKYTPNHVDVALAIMNVVSRRFTEPTARVLLRIYIVRMVSLTSDNPVLDGSSFNIDANLLTGFDDDTLLSVRDWNLIVNPPDVYGIQQRWDNIHILSGKDLVDSSDPDGGSQLLGLAFIAGTCTLGYGVAIVEDNGIATGLVSAHEIGHTLTLNHDEDIGCSSGFLMGASQLPGGDAFRWSTCSQIELREFLRWQRPYSPSACMDDIPANFNPVSPLVLPGASYSYDEQCMQLGGLSSCETSSCSRLVCLMDGSCQPQNFPAAEGTSCGQNEICLAGSCVGLASVPDPVTGGWSAWMDSPCSRTCGGGVIIRQRVCNNPFPSWGGAFCVGEGVEFRLCNLEPCSSSADDFRNEQCQATASEPFDGQIFNWEQYFFPSENILTEDLYCLNPCIQVGGNIFSDRPPGYNIDGTECWNFNPSGASDLYRCVGGICEVFGCDGVHMSNVRFDVCRICGGDSSSCSLVNGAATVSVIGVFDEFHTIPAGSTSIVITNNAFAASSHVAITGTTTGFIYFRGSGTQADLDSRVYNGDFLITHELLQTMEIFRSNGPTPEPLRLEVFWASQSSNIVQYQYYQPDTFEWDVGVFSACSSTCDGVQTRSVICRSTTTQQIFSDNVCTTLVGQKPPTTIFCSNNNCPVWIASDFGECNVVCGNGIQFRSVVCRLNGVTVNDAECDPTTRPATENSCNVGACGWVTGDFGACSVTCGPDLGQQIRTVTCSNLINNKIVLDTNCDFLPRPSNLRNCISGEDCPIVMWVEGPFGECSVDCGIGIQIQNIECQEDGVTVNDDQCDPAIRPTPQRSCDVGSCRWVTGDFGTCSVTCGPGVGQQTRTVTCANDNQAVPEANCNSLPRPSSVHYCVSGVVCSAPIWVVGTFGECSVVCGTGIEVRSVVCQADGVTVSDAQCDPATRPAAQRQCVVGNCGWVTGDFGTCSVTCGPGIGQQTRTVTCSNLNNNQAVPEANCNFLPRPISVQDCLSGVVCPVAMWVEGLYGECNAHCGAGIEIREVTCQLSMDGGVVDDSLCDPTTRPDNQRPCNSGSCRWIAGPRGTCSVTCSFGMVKRTVVCVNDLSITVPDFNCDSPTRPPSTETCREMNCSDEPQWVTSAFGECSKRCGKGIMRRTVRCQLGLVVVDDSLCEAMTKPINEQTCMSLNCTPEQICAEDDIFTEPCLP